jgi:2-iminobutanoate/2-iminopropanoate deaminase
MARKLKIDTGEPTLAPYSSGINVKDHIWLSGQIDVSVEGIEAQTRGTLAKIDELLAAANSSKADLVKVTVLLADIGYYSTVNEIYSEWLEDGMPPSRAAYGVVDLPGGALIEIVCEAFRGCGGA